MKKFIGLIAFLFSVLLFSSHPIPSWQIQQEGQTVSLRGVCAVSPHVAWASGSQGTVLKTIDGGKTWVSIAVPGESKTDFRDIQAFDAQTAIILSAGSPAKIYKTTDGGTTWKLKYTNKHPNVFFNSMAFWDKNNAFAFSDPIDKKFLLLRTTDAGETWTVIPAQNIPAAYDGEAGFAASGTMVATQGKTNAWFVTGGKIARVFRSTDKGDTWEAVKAPVICGNPPEGIFSVTFYDEKNGLIVGGNYKEESQDIKNAAYTTNGGKTWKPVKTNRPAGFRECAAYVPGYHGKFVITVGPSGSDYSLDRGRTWKPFSDHGFHSLSLVPGHPTGWAVGKDGIIAKFKLKTVIDQKVDHLLSKMTLKEKIGQMVQIPAFMIWRKGALIPGASPKVDPVKLKGMMEKYQIGSFLGGRGYTAKAWAGFIRELQDMSMKYQRNHIPTIYGIDHVHGSSYLAEGTLFPQNFTLAASFNPRFAYEQGRITVEETAALGHHWNFAPILGLAENKLWPRFYETFGEDPLLVSTMGAAYVNGFREQVKKQSYKAVACAKHFLGYSDPRTGFDRSPAQISRQRLQEFFRPSFQAAIDAGVRTVMVNSGEINSVPVHASYDILTKLLREDMGFDGVVISDWEDVMGLHTRHKVAKDKKEAVYKAIMAGIDISMTTMPEYCDLLEELVKEGKITGARIDQSVRRVLKLKHELGLFDNPFPSLEDALKTDRKANTGINLEAARESIVLVKNKGKLLPLGDSVKNILVAGPNAHTKRALLGGWSYEWRASRDAWFPAGIPTLYESLKSHFKDKKVELVEDGQLTGKAADADVLILAVGEEPYAEGYGSIIDLDLEQRQTQLIQTALATRKPVILVLIEGRPRTIPSVFDKCHAVVFAGLPGKTGGRAIAEILGGTVNPSGKLPFTYPYKQGNILSYHHKHHAISLMHPLKDERLRYSIAGFGHGLSYTRFKYQNLELDKTGIDKNGSITARVTVANIGGRTGKEAVLWYISDHYGTITRPVKLLKHFEKRELKPGESVVFKFQINPEKHLTYPGADGRMILEPGDFTLSVGGLNARFQLK